jgi:hypothetical protein
MPSSSGCRTLTILAAIGILRSSAIDFAKFPFLNELALRRDTYATIADRYSRTEQAVKQFAARNANEIRVIRAGQDAELQQRLSEVAIADQARRIANYGDLREELQVRLETGPMDAQLASQVVKAINALNRSVAEELGQLHTRSTVTLDATPELVNPAPKKKVRFLRSFSVISPFVRRYVFPVPRLLSTEYVPVIGECAPQARR